MLSTFGPIGSDGTQFCNQLASGFRCNADVEDIAQNKQHQLSQQLQITLKREIARMLLQGTHGQFCLSPSPRTAGADGEEAFRDEQLPDEADALAADLIEELKSGRRESQAAGETAVGGSVQR